MFKKVPSEIKLEKNIIIYIKIFVKDSHIVLSLTLSNNLLSNILSVSVSL